MIEQSSELNHLSQLVSDIEFNKKKLPILLKHYQSMQPSILGFNLDHHFGGSLDCLCIGYLKNIPLKKLQYYMGKKEAETYLHFQTDKSDLP